MRKDRAEREGEKRKEKRRSQKKGQGRVCGGKERGLEYIRYMYTCNGYKRGKGREHNRERERERERREARRECGESRRLKYRHSILIVSRSLNPFILLPF